MRVAISGASGLIGSALRAALEQDGHTVQPLVRRPTGDPNEIQWQPQKGTIDSEKLVGTHAVVHLAGEPIIGVRWTEQKKQRVLDSRVLGTRLIAQTLGHLDQGPRVLISASAIGFYGDSREWVDEDSPAGQGFLADVCNAWETAAGPARDAGLRVVHPRIGLVMSATGGVLGPMLPAFKLGVGGPLGDGSQYFPWVTLDDVVGAIRFALDEEITGPVNVVAPNPVTNAEFASALSAALRRPAFFRVPRFAIRAALGEMGQETLLSGQRARPARLLEAGYSFQFPELEAALAHLLG